MKQAPDYSKKAGKFRLSLKNNILNYFIKLREMMIF